MKGIYFASFYFRVWDLTREICENKNPAKISTYTVTVPGTKTEDGPLSPLHGLAICRENLHLEPKYARIVAHTLLDVTSIVCS